MNLEGTKDNVIDDVTTSIEEKLIDLSSNMKKQKVDFVWKQKNGLRYVSDKSLELVYELLKMQKDNLWIECVDDKIIFHNQFINFCNINKTSQELLLEVQNTSNN